MNSVPMQSDISLWILIVPNRGYPKPLCILFSDTKGIQWAGANATLRVNGCTEGFPLHFYVFTRSTQEKTDLRIGPSVLPFSDNLYSTLAGTSAKTCRIQERKQGRMNLAKNWNTNLRWVHLIFFFLGSSTCELCFVSRAVYSLQ